MLALFDFSSAFDTIDHPILVHRLHTDFGFIDAVLDTKVAGSNSSINMFSP